MSQSNRFHVELRSRRGWAWRLAAGVALATTAVWSTPPGLPFDDLARAYNAGQVTEARALARKYLTSSEAAVQNATSDSKRFDALLLLIRAAILTAGYEARFPVAGRFRNAMDLLAQVEQAATTIEGAAVPAERRNTVLDNLGGICRSWLVATMGIKSPAERAQFLRTHAGVLATVGVQSLDEPDFKVLNERPALGADGEQQLAAVVQGFVRGYAARDTTAISALTRSSELEVGQCMAAGRMQFFAASADRVSKITLRPISGDFIAQNGGMSSSFLVYVPDVEMQLVKPDGTAYSKTVDRVLQVFKDDAGRLKINMPANCRAAGATQ